MTIEKIYIRKKTYVKKNNEGKDPGITGYVYFLFWK